MNIVVIEDDADIREFIEIALNIGFPESDVKMTHLGKTGVSLALSENPDIVLVDLGLPDMRGFDVIKEIRASSSVPIIVETARNSDTDIVQGLTMGADDYIDKPYSQMELIARIKTVLRRVYPQTSGISEFHGLQYDEAKHLITFGSETCYLTPTEAAIFYSFMKKADKRLTFDDLASVIWGIDYTGANDTIRVYIHRLREKLEMLSNNTLTFVYKRGDAFYLSVK